MSSTIRYMSRADPGATVVILQAELDRAPRAGGRELDDPEPRAVGEVGVEPPAEADVERLRSIDVRHRDDDHLELRGELRDARARIVALNLRRAHRGLQGWICDVRCRGLSRLDAAVAPGTSRVDTRVIHPGVPHVPAGRSPAPTSRTPRSPRSCSAAPEPSSGTLHDVRHAGDLVAQPDPQPPLPVREHGALA